MSSQPSANPPADTAIPGVPMPISTFVLHQGVAWLLVSLAIFFLAAVCFIFHLGQGPLAGTEGHRAITAEQMLHNGNYLLPRLYGHLYLAKPPMAYWLIAFSEHCFGPGEFVWRLPSAVASALLAAGICVITAAWFDSLAGFAAGIAFIALIPLWSQNRSADVDAINHLGCVLAALAIIDMAIRKTRIPLWIFLVATLGTAICCLTKGPAGLPIIIGAIIGPALANRELRPFRRASIYLAILLGILPLILWAALAYHAMGPQFVSDLSGAAEAKNRMLMISNVKHLPLVLTLPLVVVAYGMPVSALLAVPLLPGIRNRFDLDKKRLIRAIGGAIVIAFFIQICTGMTNPRYAFLNLPLLCPLAGALVFAWRRNYWPGLSRATVTSWLAMISIAYCCVGVAILLLTHRLTSRFHPGPLLGLLSCLCIAALAAGRLRKTRWCAAMATLSICTAALIYGVHKSSEESVRSAKPQAAALAKYVSPAEPILSWNVLWSQPELFYYAHLHPTVMHPLPGTKLPAHAWMVLDNEEWRVWQNNPNNASHLTRVLKLQPYKHMAYVCWYSQ